MDCPDGALLCRAEDLPDASDLAVAGVLDITKSSPLPVLHLAKEELRTMSASSCVCGGSLILVMPVNISVGRPVSTAGASLYSLVLVENIFMPSKNETYR